eukprot:s1448_g13.t1
MSEAMTLENLVDRLKDRPTIVSHIYNLLEMGAYDQIDQPEKVDQDSLPKCCNKFALLSRDNVMQLIEHLCPTFKEGLHAINAQSKISKKELLQTFCYMCHVASDSALPSKSWASLKKFERWEMYGKRLGDHEPEDGMTFAEWIKSAHASYWQVEGTKLKFITGAAANLPAELQKLDDLSINDGISVYEASVGCGMLKVKCTEVFGPALKQIDLPWWRREVQPMQAPSSCPSLPGTLTPVTSPGWPMAKQAPAAEAILEATAKQSCAQVAANLVPSAGAHPKEDDKVDDDVLSIVEDLEAQMAMDDDSDPDMRLHGKQPVLTKLTTTQLSLEWKNMSKAEKQPFVDQSVAAAKANKSQKDKILQNLHQAMPEPMTMTASDDTDILGLKFPWGLEMLEVQSVLGKGTYGVVYLGVSSVSKFHIAIKCSSTTNPKRTVSPEEHTLEMLGEKEWLREVCHHPNVVQCFGVVVGADHQVGLVLELCHQNLLQFLDERPLVVTQSTAPPTALLVERTAFAAQAALGLIHCHQKEVIHCDIKPNNFLLSDGSRPGTPKVIKLADFGLARKCQPGCGVKVNGAKVYNRFYRPPECDSDVHKALAAHDVPCLLHSYLFQVVEVKSNHQGLYNDRL